MIENGFRHQFYLSHGIVLLIVAAVLAASVASSTVEAKERATNVSRQMVDESVCASCHGAESQQWQSSHHAQALTPVKPIHKDQFSHLLPDEHPLYAIGYAPLQQVLIETDKGKLQAHNLAWDTEQQRWFDLYSEVSDNPQHPMHWRQPAHLANTQCISCHVTNYQLNYDQGKQSFASSWQALGVGCQSCHGPAQQHVQWADSVANGEPTAAIEPPNKGFLLNLTSTDEQLQVCAQCHSRRNELKPFQPTVSVHDQFLLSPLTADLYEVDGTIHDEVFEYGSFIQSKMHQAGVVCSDCHNAHSGSLRVTDAQQSSNAVCTQCHTNVDTPVNIPAQRLASINLAKLKQKNYDSAEHHFHAQSSAGAQCVNCHMPGKIYMGNDERHDHSFSSPNPRQALELKHSDACLDCHNKQPEPTIVAAFERWYPNAQARDLGYARTMYAARNGQAGAAPAILKLLDHNELPLLRRSALLSELVNYPSVTAQQQVLKALQHSDAMLRRTAVEVAPSLFGSDWLNRNLPLLLRDSALAVRVTAVDQLMALNIPLSAQQLAEYSSLQQHHLSRAEGHFNLSMVAASKGQTDTVEAHLQAALQRDPNFAPAIVALAQWLEPRQPKRALSQLQQAFVRNPQAPDLAFALALMAIRQGDLSHGIDYLGQATQLAPDNHHFSYVLAIALYDNGQQQQARALLREVLAKAPQQRDVRLALWHYTDKPDERKQLMQEWQQLNPNDPVLTPAKVN